MVATALDGLRSANQYLAALLGRVQSDSADYLNLTPTDFSDLLSHLLLAGEWLRAATSESGQDANAQAEIAQYRSHMSRLQMVLPELQARLLVHRAQLEAERKQVAAVAAWSTATRGTL